MALGPWCLRPWPGAFRAAGACPEAEGARGRVSLRPTRSQDSLRKLPKARWRNAAASGPEGRNPTAGGSEPHPVAPATLPGMVAGGRGLSRRTRAPARVSSRPKRSAETESRHPTGRRRSASSPDPKGVSLMAELGDSGPWCQRPWPGCPVGGRGLPRRTRAPACLSSRPKRTKGSKNYGRQQLAQAQTRTGSEPRGEGGPKAVQR